MRVRKWFVLVLLLAMFAAACGSDDGSGDDASDSDSAVTGDDAGDEGDDGDASDDGDAGDDGDAADGGDTADGADTDDDGDGAAPAGPSGELRYAVPLGPGSFDAHTENRDFGMIFYTLVYDGLVNEQADNTLEPGLATEWEITPTDARFTLREGVTFHDGTPFDAEVVKWNIEKAKATPGTTGALVRNIDSVEAVSPTEVVFNMTGPDPDLLNTLARFPGMMMNPNVSPEDLASGAVSAGTGPYQIVTRNESELVLETNPNYWDPEDQGFERVTFTVLLDDEARYNALLSGEVDVATMRVFQLADAEAAGFPVAQAPANVTFVHFHDIGGNLVPEFADVRVRQAIAHLINREGWGASVTRGLGTPAVQGFAEGSPWHIDGYEGFPYDPERAAALLAEAGVTDLTFEVPSWGIFNAWHQALSAMLAEGGITMTIRDVQPGQNITEVAQQQVGASVTIWSNVHADTVFGNWLSPPTIWNPWDVPVPSVIGPYQAALAAASVDERDAAYRAMLQEAYDLAWIVPIYRNPTISGYNPETVEVVLWDNITIGLYVRDMAPIS